VGYCNMTLIVKDAFGVNQPVASSLIAGEHVPLHQPLGYDPLGEKLLVGTARDRFFDGFNPFDTSLTGHWELVQTGPGMTITGPLGGAVAGAVPYINIASGVTAASKTILLSRSSFLMPLDLRYQISASQRIANNHLIIGFVEVDPVTGAIVTSNSLVAEPEALNARNAVYHKHDGTVATTASLRARAAGSALDTLANAFGTAFSTVATGTSPNFIPATTFGFMLEREKILSRAWGQNLLTNTGGQFAFDRVMLDPTKRYKLVIIVENVAAPASTTDWRIHNINVMDATRVDVSPRNPGSSDGAKSFPAWISGGALGSLGTLTNAGTPAAPATPYFVNSAAGTNAALVLTGTSGLSVLWATNTGAAAAFVKLFNKATAPVPGTDVPEMIIPVPAAVGGVPGVAEISPGFNAYRFPLGLGIAITGGVTGAADTDTTPVAAGQVKVKLSRTV
jgi:hypothetical protein